MQEKFLQRCVRQLIQLLLFFCISWCLWYLPAFGKFADFCDFYSRSKWMPTSVPNFVFLFSWRRPQKLYKLQTPQNLATLLIPSQILPVSREMQQVACKRVQVTISHLQQPASLTTPPQTSQGDNLTLTWLNKKQPTKLVNCLFPADDLHMPLPASKVAPTLSSHIPRLYTEYWWI